MSTPQWNKTPPSPGETVVLWGRAKHGPVLRGVLLELYEDDCIGNPEEHALVEILQVLSPERAPDGYRPGMTLRFRRSTADRGYGRNWKPQAVGFQRKIGYVRILRESEATS